jgi:hypothetical protein
MFHGLLLSNIVVVSLTLNFHFYFCATSDRNCKRAAQEEVFADIVSRSKKSWQKSPVTAKKKF